MLSIFTTSVYDTYIKTPSNDNPFTSIQIQYEDIDEEKYPHISNFQIVSAYVKPGFRISFSDDKIEAINSQ